MTYAFWLLSQDGRHINTLTSKQYQRLKESIEMSEEHKKKIGDSNRGKIRSKEVKNHLSKIQKGKTHIETMGKEGAKKWKEKVSSSLKGRPR